MTVGGHSVGAEGVGGGVGASTEPPIFGSATGWTSTGTWMSATGTIPVYGEATGWAGISGWAADGAAITVSTRIVWTQAAYWQARGTASTPGASSPPDERVDYRLYPVDVDQARQALLEEATVDGDVVWELNSPPQITFSMSGLDPKALEVRPLARDVQLWRGARMLDEFVITKPTPTASKLTVRADGLLWWFGRRYVGRANRKNWITNPSFERDLGGWTPTRAANSLNPSPPTAEAVYEQAVTGARSLKAAQTVTQADNWINYQFNYTPDAGGPGVHWTLTGWFYLPSDAYVGPALEGRGLHLERFDGDAHSLEHHFAPIDDSSPLDVKTRLEVEMFHPPGVASLVNVRLYVPHGTIYWDEIGLFQDEALRFSQVDQTDIARQLVEHAQDPDFGKSDLRIGTACPPSGVPRDLVLPFDEHAKIGPEIESLAHVENGFDFDVVCGPASKTFTTWAPRRGTFRPNVVLVLLGAGETATGEFDGEQAASSVCLLGDGSGPDRPEASAIDTEAFDGNIVEAVEQAVPGINQNLLADKATGRLKQLRHPIVVGMTVPGSAVFGKFWLGDVIRARAQRGYLQFDAFFRVVRLAVNTKLDTVEVGLNVQEDHVLAGGFFGVGFG